MLYGMADAEKQALVDLGHRLRIYMPYGELIPGMAYLVRRLLENTSNDSFLRASFAENVPVEKLLMNPLRSIADDGRSPTSERTTPRRLSPICLARFATSRRPISPRGRIAQAMRRRWPTYSGSSTASIRW